MWVVCLYGYTYLPNTSMVIISEQTKVMNQNYLRISKVMWYYFSAVTILWKIRDFAKQTYHYVRETSIAVKRGAREHLFCRERMCHSVARRVRRPFTYSYSYVPAPRPYCASSCALAVTSRVSQVTRFLIIAYSVNSTSGKCFHLSPCYRQNITAFNGVTRHLCAPHVRR